MAPKAWLILAALLLICTPLWASEDHDEGDDPQAPLRLAVMGLLILGGGVLLARKLAQRWIRIVWGLVVTGLFGFLLIQHPSLVSSVWKPAAYLVQSGDVPGEALFYLGLFFAASLLFAKSICGLTCHVGGLQESLYWLARPLREKLGLKRPLRLPAWLTLTTRLLFLVLFVVFLLSLGYNLLRQVNAFHIFAGHGEWDWVLGVLAGAIFLASLVVYRPWCNLLCPFGLVSWLAERLGVVGIHIDRTLCIDCGRCVDEAPCSAMKRIYHRRGVPGDCFLCGRCVEVCPVDAVVPSIKDRKKPVKPETR
ncbi:MAG: 4Fe-4S binding protein [Candidatus Coatesbacteria bacterium]|nr:4Fe-4S binding protein [Candidatus Coatesbacteria bacterium]